MQLFIRMSYTIEILLGALVFLQAMPRRDRFPARMAAELAAIWAAGWGLSFLREMGELCNLVSLQLTIVAVVLWMWGAFEAPFMNILSACVSGVAAQHIGHHISRLAAELPWVEHWTNLLEFFCVSAVYLALYATLGRRLRNIEYYEHTDSRIVAVSVAIVLICTGITRVLRLAGGMNFYTTVATALYAITCCVLALFFEFFLYYNLRQESEHTLFRRIHEEERRQYEISRDNAELLSIKSHDLKHKLLALEGRLPQGEIDSVRSIVDTYDSIYHTGSEVLDIILNEKNLRCRSKGISITCMGSGKSLAFLDTMDAYSLFGNLLENAIAAVEQLEEPGKRIISMVIEQKGTLVSIDVMNFFQGGYLPAGGRAAPHQQTGGSRLPWLRPEKRAGYCPEVQGGSGGPCPGWDFYRSGLSAAGRNMMIPAAPAAWQGNCRRKKDSDSSDCIIREKYTKWEFTRQKATRHERGFSGKSHSNML